MVPVFIYVFFRDYPENLLKALAVFLFAGLTDVVDGYLARRNNWITDLGKMIDPLADKLMQSSALVCLYIKELIPLWIVAVFILKELFMIFGALLVLKKIKIKVKSHWHGKVTTALFYAAIVALVIFEQISSHLTMPQTILLCIVPLISAMFSMTMYIIEMVRMNSDLKANKN